MVEVHSKIPDWLQISWALAGIGVALGGLVWIVFIFWPYLRWSKKVMQKSLEIGEKTSEILRDVQEELSGVLSDVSEVTKSIREIIEDDRIEQALDRLCPQKREGKIVEVPKLDLLLRENVIEESCGDSPHPSGG